MIRKYLILFLAKQVKTLLRLFNVSGGTALPGLLVEKVYSKIFDDIATNFSQKIIVISGTNGKTSVCHFLNQMVDFRTKNTLVTKLGAPAHVD